MRNALKLAVAIFLCSAISANAAVVGEPSPLADGSRGWLEWCDDHERLRRTACRRNGVDGQLLRRDGRADGNRSVQPLIAKQEGAALLDLGGWPGRHPDAEGEHSIDLGQQRHSQRRQRLSSGLLAMECRRRRRPTADWSRLATRVAAACSSRIKTARAMFRRLVTI